MAQGLCRAIELGLIELGAVIWASGCYRIRFETCDGRVGWALVKRFELRRGVDSRRGNAAAAAALTDLGWPTVLSALLPGGRR